MFDQLEARVNQASMKKLANARASIAGVDGIPVIFDADFKVAMVGTVGMSGATPRMTIADADVPADFIDMEISVEGTVWIVAERQPDFTKVAGLSTVILEKR